MADASADCVILKQLISAAIAGQDSKTASDDSTCIDDLDACKHSTASSMQQIQQYYSSPNPDTESNGQNSAHNNTPVVQDNGEEVAGAATASSITNGDSEPSADSDENDTGVLSKDATSSNIKETGPVKVIDENIKQNITVAISSPCRPPSNSITASPSTVQATLQSSSYSSAFRPVFSGLFSGPVSARFSSMDLASLPLQYKACSSNNGVILPPSSLSPYLASASGFIYQNSLDAASSVLQQMLNINNSAMYLPDDSLLQRSFLKALGIQSCAAGTTATVSHAKTSGVAVKPAASKSTKRASSSRTLDACNRGKPLPTQADPADLVAAVKLHLVPATNNSCGSMLMLAISDNQRNTADILTTTKETTTASSLLDHVFDIEKCLQQRNREQTDRKKPAESYAFDGTTVLCQVCGDKASGFHYGVHACEGCKGFFRRSIQQKIQYRPCSKNQQCSVLRINRNRCQYCRLKKCIAVGMSREAVRFGRVPKQEKAKMLAEMQKATAQSQVNTLAAELEDDEKLIASIISAHLDTCEFSREKTLPMLQSFRRLGIQQPASRTACPLSQNNAMFASTEQRDDGQQQQFWDDFSERYSPAIRGVVDFAKSTPGFHVLSQEDQVTLLKAGVFEVLLLRLAILFDTDAKTMTLLNGSVYRRDAVIPPGHTSQGRFLVDSLFDFVDRFNCFCLNDADIALFCAVVLISPDRPGLRNVELIERMNFTLQQALKKVLLVNHGGDVSLFQQLMMKIPDLRTLNTLHSEKLLAFKMDPFQDKTRLHYKELMCQSDSSSRCARSPLSDSSSLADSPKANRAKPTSSEWSVLCKASDPDGSSSSCSDSAPDSPSSGSGTAGPGPTPKCGSIGLKETGAQINALNLSGPLGSGTGSSCKKGSGAMRYPREECSSFDSGKGTLSCKASSSSASSGEGSEAALSDHHPSDCEAPASSPSPRANATANGSPVSDISRSIKKERRSPSPSADMPTLKKALQAPPLTHLNGSGLKSINCNNNNSNFHNKTSSPSCVAQPKPRQQLQHQPIQQLFESCLGLPPSIDVRQKHMAVASLLEKRPEHCQETMGVGVLANSANHNAALTNCSPPITNSAAAYQSLHFLQNMNSNNISNNVCNYTNQNAAYNNGSYVSSLSIHRAAMLENGFHQVSQGPGHLGGGLLTPLGPLTVPQSQNGVGPAKPVPQFIRPAAVMPHPSSALFELPNHNSFTGLMTSAANGGYATLNHSAHPSWGTPPPHLAGNNNNRFNDAKTSSAAGMDAFLTTRTNSPKRPFVPDSATDADQPLNLSKKPNNSSTTAITRPGYATSVSPINNNRNAYLSSLSMH